MVQTSGAHTERLFKTKIGGPLPPFDSTGLGQDPRISFPTSLQAMLMLQHRTTDPDGPSGSSGSNVLQVSLLVSSPSGMNGLTKQIHSRYHESEQHC